MNAQNIPAKAIPKYSASGPEATLEAVEKANGAELKVACNEFLFRWVPPGMTIHEFESVSCGLFLRLAKEWENRTERPK